MATKSEVEVRNWFNDHIHDDKHFTSRFAKKFAFLMGIDVEMFAKGLVLAYCLLLIASKQADVLANLVLVIIPIILTFIYPNEQPNIKWTFIHFILFGITTLFDRVLEVFPLYYLLKCGLFLAIYLPPSKPVIERIHEFIQKLEKMAKQ